MLLRGRSRQAGASPLQTFREGAALLRPIGPIGAVKDYVTLRYFIRQEVGSRGACRSAREQLSYQAQAQAQAQLSGYQAHRQQLATLPLSKA